MIASGYDDATVMEISGHSDARMLKRYTHPTPARRVDALESFSLIGQKQGRTTESDAEKLWWTARGSNSRPPRCERRGKAAQTEGAVRTIVRSGRALGQCTELQEIRGFCKVAREK